MGIPNENYFKTSNNIFSYGLKPVQLAVYCYLLCRAGQRGHCWPSMKNIAQSVGCSVNTARNAIDALCRLEFIRKVDTFQTPQQTIQQHILHSRPPAATRGRERDRQYNGPLSACVRSFREGQAWTRPRPFGPHLGGFPRTKRKAGERADALWRRPGPLLPAVRAVDGVSLRRFFGCKNRQGTLCFIKMPLYQGFDSGSNRT